MLQPKAEIVKQFNTTDASLQTVLVFMKYRQIELLVGEKKTFQINKH